MPKAGLFAGEVTQQAPADGAATDKQNGYHWFEWGTDILEFELTSGEYAVGKGYSVTTNAYYTLDPIWAHPLNGQSYPEWTVSAVFQCSTPPTAFDIERMLFSINTSSKFGVRYYTTQQQYTIDVHIRSNPVSAYNVNIASDGLQVQGGARPHWLITDWYCVTCSYSQPLNKCTVTYVNMTRGEEVVQDAVVENNDNVEFLRNGYGQEPSTIWWGGLGSDPVKINQPWLGTAANIFIHNKYVDLTVESERRKFSGIDGVTLVGGSGEVPFGEVPLVFMPSGGPWDNRGTINVGPYNSVFYITYPPELDVNLPPIAS